MFDLRLIIAEIGGDESKLLKNMLSRAGHMVVAEAHDGITALKVIRNYEPDLVLLNVDLPGMDGIDVAKIIEEDKICPVILLSAYYTADMMERAKDAMVMGFLVKPFDESSMIATVNLAQINYDKIRDLEGEISKLSDTLESRKTVDKAKGMLMEKMNLSEGEAFKRIQKQSMEKRKSMREIADSIIIAYNL